jgi:GIY-YIG catalytic domain
MTGYVYILKCGDNSLYVGQTRQPLNRLMNHYRRNNPSNIVAVDLDNKVVNGLKHKTSLLDPLAIIETLSQEVARRGVPLNLCH